MYKAALSFNYFPFYTKFGAASRKTAFFRCTKRNPPRLYRDHEKLKWLCYHFVRGRDRYARQSICFMPREFVENFLTNFADTTKLHFAGNFIANIQQTKIAGSYNEDNGKTIEMSGKGSSHRQTSDRLSSCDTISLNSRLFVSPNFQLQHCWWLYSWLRTKLRDKNFRLMNDFDQSEEMRTMSFSWFIVIAKLFLILLFTWYY